MPALGGVDDGPPDLAPHEALSLRLQRIAIDARGRFLFAITATEHIQTFAIGSDGQLTDLGDSVPILNTATAIAADYSGNYLVVTDGGANAVKTFRIADDGSLVYVSSALRSLSPGAHAVKVSGRVQ